MKRVLLYTVILVVASCGSSRDSINSGEMPVQYEFSTNANGEGPAIVVDFKQGESFYYPLMAVWLEDMEGNYIQTLYVAKSVATGVFRYGRSERNRWVEGERRAPHTLPYWAHKRGVRAPDGLYMPSPDNPVADAYTGATPVTGFVLKSRADNTLPSKFRVMLEINQNWDWNQYWTNDKFPGDENYARSAQPAVVYEAVIDDDISSGKHLMKPIGHSHYSGKTGELFQDIGTLTTALKISESIYVTVVR